MSGTEHWTSTSMPYVTPRTQGQGDTWAEEAAAQGRKGTQRITFAGEVAAPDEAAALLGLAPGEPAVVRRRVIELDGEPVELTDTYYPVEIARGTPLAGTAKIRGGAVTLLAELGHTGARVVETVTARLPTDEECDLLHIDARQPVLRLARQTLDAHDRPIQADLMTMPAHRQRLRYEMRTG
ncbi:GntR family transcriptional regulator [Streptomyces thermolilacinus]|uniref:GntR family transcriptional regulator n=1 Tax=Streptomyces thermolilacinus TaxID=285540 RepID=UPI0033E48F56